MEKQHNRGQDGAGIATVKLNVEPGYPFLHRLRSSANQPIADLFSQIGKEIQEIEKYQPEIKNHPGLMKGHVNFLGELLLGHLRYGTQGKNNVEFCHPFIKRDTIPTRNLALAGNFNLVNTEELFGLINVDPGVFQRQSDLAAMMEVIHHFLVKADEAFPGKLDIVKVLKKAVPLFDGGFNFCGIIGNGKSFVVRDAHGIRPAYYYKDEEVVVVASERPAIQTAFNVHRSKVQEIKPGYALIIKKDGSVGEVECTKPLERKACSFERIYFSRGSDFEIYQERKTLGKLLVPTILNAVNHDVENTVFSYIPNTAEVAFIGMTEEIQKQHIQKKLQAFNNGEIKTTDELHQQLSVMPRVEKIAIKDVKMRTFITDDSSRNDLVQHVYDVTYGLVKNNEDTLVVLDDSIVRGTTLKESILTMLDRLQPKKIIVVSSAPQIRYPDCYGIDMSKMGSFVAFQAAVQLWKDKNEYAVLEELYKECKEEIQKPLHEVRNLVKQVYAPFSAEEISAKIADIVKPNHIFSDVQVIYQTIENLHIACPDNLGDWYFTGDYPTPGGNRVALNAFINYMEGKNVRAY